MTKVLVTGSTGNIGQYVVEKLMEEGVPTRAAVTNIERGKKFYSTLPVELVVFDFLRQETYREALEGVNKVFLMRPPKLANPKKDILPFLKEAKSAAVEQIVFVSLLGVEKNPVVPHRKIEDLILKLDFQYTFLRPSFFMQNLNTTHRDDILIRNELFMPVGNAKTSFIDTRDIGEIAAICLMNEEHLNKKYTLTGSEAITYYEVAETMSKVLNRTITYSNPGILEFRRTIMKRGTPKGFANVMTMLYVMTKLGTAGHITDDAKRILNRDPILFREYVEDHKEFFQHT
ncbi:SDR family oxidoreductase [Bacillus sp. JJ1764]|uniref:SDR family oxidoreductase n=1 Tax=Bacillus sp. JJ1764 TaxID=3122964 RepID=UPI00300083A0